MCLFVKIFTLNKTCKKQSFVDHREHLFSATIQKPKSYCFFFWGNQGGLQKHVIPAPVYSVQFSPRSGLKPTNRRHDDCMDALIMSDHMQQVRSDRIDLKDTVARSLSVNWVLSGTGFDCWVNTFFHNLKEHSHFKKKKCSPHKIIVI